VGLDLDDPMVLHLFAHSLPIGLADSCIDIKNLEMFEQWTKAAQRHYWNWLQKRAIHSNYSGTNNRQQNQKGNQGGNSFYWHRPQGNQNNSSPSCSRWQAKNPNAMDTSAVARKATTDAEKEQHRKEECCFKCSQQGHLAHNCPNRKPCTWAANTEKEKSNTSERQKSYTPAEAAAFIKNFSDKEREEFIKSLQALGENAGFQVA
jgi:Zinc knuckle